MTSLKLIPLHFALMLISSLFICKKRTFFSIFETIVQNKLLHLLHTSLISNLILTFTSLFTDLLLGKLQESETAAYNEKVYEVCGDFFMLISIFSNELSIKNITTLALLYAFKSFSWVFAIKSQKNGNKKMLLGSMGVTAIATAIIIKCYYSSMFLSILLCLEYSLIVLSLIKNQMIMSIDMCGIETNRTLLMFFITITYLILKSCTFLAFIIKLSKMHRFPYNTLRALISTGLKLYKKLILFKKYLKLLRDLNSIKESPVVGNCAICTDDITMGKKLKCSHVFHSQCLNMWCEKEVSCPICRAELVFEREEQIETEDEILFGVPVELEVNE